MARHLTDAEFNKYREQGLKRWVQFQEFSLAHSDRYELARRRAKHVAGATTVLAILTALLAVAAQVFGGDGDGIKVPTWPTAVVGGLTGVIGILQRNFDFEKRAEIHRKHISGARDGLIRIRQWIETISDGYMKDDDESFINSLDGQFIAMAETSEIQEFSKWEEIAQERLDREGLASVEFRAPTDGLDLPRFDAPQQEQPTEGIRRPQRGRGVN